MHQPTTAAMICLVPTTTSSRHHFFHPTTLIITAPSSTAIPPRMPMYTKIIMGRLAAVGVDRRRAMRFKITHAQEVAATFTIIMIALLTMQLFPNRFRRRRRQQRLPTTCLFCGPLFSTNILRPDFGRTLKTRLPLTIFFFRLTVLTERISRQQPRLLPVHYISNGWHCFLLFFHLLRFSAIRWWFWPSTVINRYKMQLITLSLAWRLPTC